jgi:putative membrane protein insertion efficiency factor
MTAARSTGDPDRAPEPERLRRRMSSIAIAPIHLYQRAISPALPRRCKYEPTCSAYAAQAVREYGILRWPILAGWRLMRCNPWSHGGYDPVHEQRLFSSRPTDHASA